MTVAAPSISRWATEAQISSVVAVYISLILFSLLLGVAARFAPGGVPMVYVLYRYPAPDSHRLAFRHDPSQSVDKIGRLHIRPAHITKTTLEGAASSLDSPFLKGDAKARTDSRV